jgi:hypothetical protein
MVFSLQLRRSRPCRFRQPVAPVKDAGPIQYQGTTRAFHAILRIGGVDVGKMDFLGPIKLSTRDIRIFA